VTGATALLLASSPLLTPDQAAVILTRSSDDVNAATGCRQCPLQRDRFSGWGRLNVLRAIQSLAGPLPPADAFETNDDAAGSAWRLWGPKGRKVQATLDFWDDQNDVYAVRLRPGERLGAALEGPPGAKLYLWKPGTKSVEGLSIRLQSQRVAQSQQRAAAERFAYRTPARGAGWHFLQVKLEAPGGGAYTLTVEKRRPGS
jgi:hypothetical protein